MNCKLICIVGIGFMLLGNQGFGQKKKPLKDSTKIYRDIEAYSKRHKFMGLIYGLVFEPASTLLPTKTGKIKTYKRLIQKPYSAFEGKIIRNINIETLDPFGYSVKDTSVSNSGFFYRVGNAMHLKSLRSNIRNLMLIRPNQVFDSLLVKESERLIRKSIYVREVSFRVHQVSPRSDSVDIFVRELDKWSIVPDLLFPSGGSTLALVENNFLGLGHQFSNSYTWYPTDGFVAYNTNYFIPNIRNTYINTALHYGADEFRIYTKSFAVDRPFFSPFAKWAMGLKIAQKYRTDSVHTSDSLFELRKFNSVVQDYWVGSGIQLFRGKTENDRTTNLITTLRYYGIRYKDKSPETFDSLKIYTNENFFLAGLGISTRKYVQDNYIFNYGITEDIPIGQVYGFTAGVQQKNGAERIYLGARTGWGNYYQWGYLSTNVEYGTFIGKTRAEQGELTAGTNYFTGLLNFGKWRFRQFVKGQATIGINRFVYDRLTLNEYYSQYSYNFRALAGTHRLLLTFQSQFYAPWNLIGFRFGPYLVYSLGMLGNSTSGFSNSKVYSQIGFGLLIKNINLVFSTFQISIAYYPIMPGSTNVFKFNPINTKDFGFRDFDLGKPTDVAFK